jgi:hypothetical protein
MRKNMGAIFPVLDKDVEGIDISSVSGKMINRYEPELSQILVNNNLRSIMTFFGANPAEYFDDEEFLEFEIPEEQLVEKWFEPEAGLEIVRYLITRLSDKPNMLGDETNQVVEDLKAVEEVLEKAQSANAKWHIEIEI